MVTLKPAPTSEIRENWQFFVTGIGEVIDKCGLDFHPADVYREITSGNGPVLFWIERDEDIVGMTVVCEEKDRYTERRSLLLDMTYLSPHSDCLDELRAAIDHLAKSAEVDYIEWFSPRLGWDRVMERIGYKSSYKAFSREVDYG